MVDRMKVSPTHLTSHNKTWTFLHQAPFEGEHGGRNKCTIGIGKNAWEFY